MQYFKTTDKSRYKIKLKQGFIVLHSYEVTPNIFFCLDVYVLCEQCIWEEFCRRTEVEITSTTITTTTVNNHHHNHHHHHYHHHQVQSFILLIYTSYTLKTPYSGRKLLKKNYSRRLTLLWPCPCLDQFQNLICSCG